MKAAGKRTLVARMRLAVLCALFVFVWFGLYFLNRPEPTYSEKPLSYWMERMADPRTASHASSVLVEMGPEAIPALTDALQSDPSRISNIAYAVMVRLHLATQRNYDAPSIRATAAYLLGQMGKDAAPAAGSLVIALKDDDALVRFRAIRALSQIGEPAIPVLGVALTDSEQIVRYGAAKALGGMGAKGRHAVPVLIQALSDPASVVREAAFQSLAAIGEPAQKALGPANVPHLVHALTNSHSATAKKFSVHTLAKIGPNARPAVPALLSAKTSSPELAGDIQEALQRIGQ